MNAFIFHAARLKDSENNLRAPENERIHFYIPGGLKIVKINQRPLKMNAFIFHAGQLKDTGNNPRAPENERIHFYMPGGLKIVKIN